MKNKIVAAFCISMLSVMLVMTGCSSKQAEKESDKKTESVKKTEDEVETKKTEKTSDDSTKEETQRILLLQNSDQVSMQETILLHSMKMEVSRGVWE